MSQTYLIPSDKRVLAMSSENQPVAKVPQGEPVVFETLDCFSNFLQREDQLFTSVGWECINPATGPVWVDGAEPGDILRVDILDIVIADHGVIASAPGFGEMGDRVSEVTRIVPIRDGKACFEWKRGTEKLMLESPLKPMIGVIGVAPESGSIPTGTPGVHGGNMDCKRITKGATLYLPVSTPGALFAVGDLHAVMGDGEVVVCGLEISGQVTVSFSVIKNKSWPLPLLVQEGDFMTIASARALDDAATMATRNMHEFLVKELLFDETDAAMLLSVNGNLCICQVVDPLKTARMELPLTLLDKCGVTLP